MSENTAERVVMSDKYNITQKVVEYFIKEIEENRLIVGEKLPSENELTSALGTSRSSVRAAIQQFVGIGAMESIHGKGTYLIKDDLSPLGNRKFRKKSYDFGDMNALLEFRLIIEADATYYAAERMTEKHLNNLRDYLDKMQKSVGNSNEFVHLDMCFHLEIAEATGNPFIIGSLKEAFIQKEEYLHTINENYGYVDGIYYHTLLIKAFEMKDAQRAKRTMKNHLQKAIDDIFYEETTNSY